MNNDIFFTSDTHFGHANIIKYSKRPYSNVEEMNEKMVENWNAIVKPNALVHHLGDVAFMPFKNTKAIFRRLNGIKKLIRGNHDGRLFDHKVELLNEGIFASMMEYEELRIPGLPMIITFHYGMRTWNKAHRSSIHLYGHSHGSLPPFGRSVDVGVDCKEITSDYRPIHLDEILHYMKDREFVPTDHHGRDDDE